MVSALFLSLASIAAAKYTLQSDYVSGGNFFSNFDFFTSGDPTHGFVQYQSQAAAQSLGLISQSSSNVYIGAEHSQKQPKGTHGPFWWSPRQGHSRELHANEL